MKGQQVATKENGALKQQGQPTPPQKRESLIPELTAKDVKLYLCPAATDPEIGFFVRFCVDKKLNPFAREAYLVKYSGQPAFIVIDVYKYIEPASRHPQYDGFEAGVIVLTKKGDVEDRVGEIVTKDEVLIGGWCRVHRKDVSRPFEVRFPLSMWDKNQAVWKTNKPHMMVKTVIKHCHTQAFPGLDNRSIPDEEVEITDVMVYEGEKDAPASERTAIAPAEEVPEGAVEQAETPDPEKVREAMLNKRRRMFFMHMRKKHKLSGEIEIRERVSKVLGVKVEHIKDFTADDEQFMKWAAADEFHFDEDPAKELFTDYARPKGLDD